MTIKIFSLDGEKQYTFIVEFDWIDSQTIGFQFLELNEIKGN